MPSNTIPSESSHPSHPHLTHIIRVAASEPPTPDSPHPSRRIRASCSAPCEPPHPSGSPIRVIYPRLSTSHPSESQHPSPLNGSPAQRGWERGVCGVHRGAGLHRRRRRALRALPQGCCPAPAAHTHIPAAAHCPTGALRSPTLRNARGEQVCTRFEQQIF